MAAAFLDSVSVASAQQWAPTQGATQPSVSQPDVSLLKSTQPMPPKQGVPRHSSRIISVAEPGMEPDAWVYEGEGPSAWLAGELPASGIGYDHDYYGVPGHGQAYDAGYDPLFPNRPYLVPRLADRLRWRPLFPQRPHLRGSWSGGPPLEQPRTFWFNPFAIQQGMGNFMFRGNHPADTGSLGFPFSTVPSHVVDRIPRPYFGHGQSYVGPRHIDRGQPLVGTSWTNRPFYVEGYTGALLAWNLSDSVDQTHGTISGVRLGWDFEHFWGTEFGLGFGSTRTSPGGADVSIRMADVSVLYYPWGDSRWRPYTGMGLGVGRYAFLDSGQVSINEFALQIPLSVGVKYAFKPWWALRLDATNYLVMPADNLRFMNNVALSMAVEFRFGGQRRSYFPYSPSIQLR